MELTNAEQLAIEKLKEVAKIWPKSLWLYSTSGGTLYVIKKDNEDKSSFPQIPFGQSQVDPRYIVGSIDIENDSGDW